MSDNTTRRIAAIMLPNGLEVVAEDASRHYYGDFHLVKLSISVLVKPHRSCFETEEEFESMVEAFPEGAWYRAEKERMGVASADVPAILDELLANFRAAAVPYLGSPEFPRRFLLTELAKRNRRKSVVLEGPWARR